MASGETPRHKAIRLWGRCPTTTQHSQAYSVREVTVLAHLRHFSFHSNAAISEALLLARAAFASLSNLKHKNEQRRKLYPPITLAFNCGAKGVKSRWACIPLRESQMRNLASITALCAFPAKGWFSTHPS